MDRYSCPIDQHDLHQASLSSGKVCEKYAELGGQIEVDESYFGSKRIRGKVSLDRVIHSDGWCRYHGLVDIDYAKHYRVDHGCNEFANDKSHINCIESFWAYATLRLSKMKGIRKEMFYLHLKETEFRFNHRHDNVYKFMLNMLREEPILVVLLLKTLFNNGFTHAK